MIRFGLFVLALFAVTLNYAQVQQPVEWAMSQNQVSDTEFDLIFTATMDDEWKIYSQFTEEGGPVPTTFEFDEGGHYTRDGVVKETGKKKEGPDPLFDNIIVIKFIKSQLFLHKESKSPILVSRLLAT